VIEMRQIQIRTSAKKNTPVDLDLRTASGKLLPF
jgi:hypothetical protein